MGLFSSSGLTHMKEDFAHSNARQTVACISRRNWEIFWQDRTLSEYFIIAKLGWLNICNRFTGTVSSSYKADSYRGLTIGTNGLRYQQCWVMRYTETVSTVKLKSEGRDSKSLQQLRLSCALYGTLLPFEMLSSVDASSEWLLLQLIHSSMVRNLSRAMQQVSNSQQ